MELLVEDVLKMDCMKNANIIAGRTGLKNKISYTTIMDVPDIFKWLHGGEMIFAAELFYVCANKDFFNRLHEKSVSAIITKPTYTNKLNDFLIKQCDELCLPIITVDKNASWSDITYPITEHIARKQYDAIYQSQLFHSALLNSVIHGKSIDQLCYEIYRSTGLTIAILDADFHISGSSINIDWKKALYKFTINSCIYRSTLTTDISGHTTSGYLYTNFYLNSLNKQILIFPVILDSEVFSYIFLLTNRNIESLNVEDSMKISQLSLIILLLKVKQSELINTNRRYNNLILDLILQGKMSNPGKYAFTEDLIEHTLYDSYYIALAHCEDISYTKNRVKQNIRTSRLFETINKNKHDFEDVLCFERGDNLVFFIPKNDVNIERTINKLYSVCAEILETNSLYIGISNTITNSEFPLGFNQALQALQYIQSHQKKKYCFYNDLGVLRIFMERSGHLNKDILIEYKKKYIVPLRNYDNKNNTQLEKTLYCLIECNYSKTEAEKKLFIHKNTLRARILKIEQLLNCDLNNSEDMFNIQLAIKINYCFDE